jgi:3-methyl-2-oxobutanoate hydroxymethyltransferase
MHRLTLNHLLAMKHEQKKITMLTLYDASFASNASEAGVDILLVGDSLGMVFKGQESTLFVSLEEMVYHTRCVAKGNRGSIIMSDFPFMSYYSLDKAAASSQSLFQAGAQILKIEGGAWLADTIHFLSERGIPICAHIGFTPQFIHSIGGYKVQGKDKQQAKELMEAALCLEQAGSKMLLVECIPYRLAREIAEKVSIPVIGIGAGPFCDGQVLVIYDLLGLTPERHPRFVKNFLIDSKDGIKGAIKKYVEAVRQNTFPTLEHSYE